MPEPGLFQQLERFLIVRSHEALLADAALTFVGDQLWAHVDGSHALDVLQQFMAENGPKEARRRYLHDLNTLRRHESVDGNLKPTDGYMYCKRCSFLSSIGEPFPCPEVISLASRYGFEIPAGVQRFLDAARFPDEAKEPS
jgi:hypothetical protein